ncbi:rhodanese-like domain-containing protein [Pseudoxanthomonas kaohsiungensis]|uniref:Rhodanese-like domain-containing protein n=1 Tax=Pseudoxanthomonas kaohsiungensis TaxID=283923 RepID=A0ABW3LZ80_9GAMM|nr:rhodanese-like domain-containing protein [Pseudoxanthomonas kaohsiungensis]KAF1701215.1 sulfurtransferase [Pseudoxanthomonas kaohsiungensis]
MPVDINELVAAAQSRIREVEPGDCLAGEALVVDVREPAEFAQGHLPGAVNLPRGVLEFQIRAHPAVACRTAGSPAPASLPLLLYCLTGGRSALAADSLRQLGFEDVRSLAGGLRAWRNAGLPVSMD